MSLGGNIELDLRRFRARVLAASVFVFFAFSLLGLRLIYLQIWRYQDLFEQAENNRKVIAPVVPTRGVIMDRNGVIVASNYSAYTLEITPSKTKIALDELIDPVKYPRAFRVINTNKQWISTGNDYALKVLKKSKVAVIGDTTGYGTSSAKTAQELLEAAGVKPVYTVLLDPNKTDLSDELAKARAAGADVLMPWSAATGLLGRLLNARGDMGWNVPVVGHPAVMAPQIRKLLTKPEYWEQTFASGYASTT